MGFGLPSADGGELTSWGGPPAEYPTAAAKIGDHIAKRLTDEPEASPLPGAVVPALFTKEGNSDEVRQHLDAAVRAMESGISETPKSEEELAAHARLRMLYLVAGRQEDALRPVPMMAPAIQEFWTKQLSGLSAWLDTQQTDPTRRVVAAKRILDESMSGLIEAAPLEIRNMAFCTEIQSYGCVTPFEDYEFEPGQEVLLYAEIENFTSEETSRGYHTALRSSYQIFDSREQRVANRDCPKTEEYCKNPRRDFFIGYHLVLPEKIYPGKHTLQLTIEDLRSRKIGQASIDLMIKEPAQDSPAEDGKAAEK